MTSTDPNRFSGQLWRAALIISASAFILVGCGKAPAATTDLSAATDASLARAGSPKLDLRSVTKDVPNESGGTHTELRLVIVSHDDRPVTVSRIVINKQFNVPQCDFNASNPYQEVDVEAANHLHTDSFPMQMALGNSLEMAESPYCGNFVRVLIKTDRGDRDYDLP